eukprot:gnl/TRDRNA2_/TRDRNA2_136557_c0_seq1.p1 gnl/TRDRNA2_/TRDRNA2_136557_c0~~gnl/TRDRNA2_/TRDRNA2_136557_c0_seq1.p1  ORF type:complete len:444 (+),score=64.31 gnl/TRDRNA2_/TRDRNA2_136557_c0_seq1:155-1333(+)
MSENDLSDFLMAIAKAVRGHRTLEHLTLRTPEPDVYNTQSDHCAETIDTVLQAFVQNVTLVSIESEPWGLLRGLLDDWTLYAITKRNWVIWEQARTLAALARGTKDTGFRSLVEKSFRRQVFRFFLPLGCKMMPVDFALGCGAHDAQPCQAEHSAVPTGSKEQASQETSGAPYSAGERTAPAIRTAAVAADKEGDEELTTVINASVAEAVERANSDLAAALAVSKGDIPPSLNADGVVLLRLDRHARAAEVGTALRESPALAACRAIVQEAGCELQPAWANGTWILLPLTQELFEEADLETNNTHILALDKDQGAVREALQAVKYHKRPKLKSADMLESMHQVASAGNSSTPSDPRDWITYAEDENVDIIVQATFIEVRPRIEEGSGPHSAP